MKLFEDAFSKINEINLQSNSHDPRSILFVKLDWSFSMSYEIKKKTRFEWYRDMNGLDF